MPGPISPGQAVADLIVEERVTRRRRRADDLDAGAAATCRPGHVEPAGDPVRRLGGVDEALSEAYRGPDRPAAPPGVGDDGDQPNGLGEPARRRHRRSGRGGQGRPPHRGIGRALFGVDARSPRARHDVPVPRRRHEPGELQCRGPWIAATYYNDRGQRQLHDDGWLRTGDVATMDGAVASGSSTARKDLIKSGGEWISSVEHRRTS